ncbi:hypothetical protein GCM10011380_31380 [Sphingomonas metalli]|uniref:Uncharacterized protein n=1 Tax=Sphingomonas metalli TaxID=1779358 RepID=A0A916WWI9_9SPHN|nr:hypothetical protein GCM10011380_31380 [Sphingomonas metalli]
MDTGTAACGPQRVRRPAPYSDLPVDPGGRGEKVCSSGIAPAEPTGSKANYPSTRAQRVGGFFLNHSGQKNGIQLRAVAARGGTARVSAARDFPFSNQ